MSIRLAIKSLPLGKQLNFRERGGAKRLTCQSESTEKIESGAERSGFGTEEEFTYILTTQILLFQLRASRVYLLIVIAMFSWSNDQIFCKKLMKSLCVNQATSNLKGLSVRAGHYFKSYPAVGKRSPMESESSESKKDEFTADPSIPANWKIAPEMQS
ncbi:conserved hypothetical protein [Ricinus communis]|uniref:Uncharacterized protein n=1 Tax=Ricinus communis TaxID=3988 RepID=B9TAK4_RICCO|nr:conserved hypothetical protein [Ricinus communis]